LSFSVATYNVLATSYIQYARYRRTPKMVLDPAWRVPALVQYVTTFAADVLCLQEVEMDVFAALNSRLNSAGYAGHYARKLAGKPDGCATFYRHPAFELIGTRVIAYADGTQETPDSGHIALVVLLRAAGRSVGVANTHLIWAPADATATAQSSYRQALQLLNECQTMAPSPDGWLICGDFNATPGSEIIALYENAGFHYAHSGLASIHTCKVNAEAKMIDYLFHSPELRAEPRNMFRVSHEAVLPSAEHPSDHLPVVARFFWKG
jgi:mRNA deadenylase 3'-5' endonuclease subunit Ccr4